MTMKKAILITLVLITSSILFAQQKFALVIGNGDYTSISKLFNTVNDATDMTEILQGLGFAVDKVLDGSQVQMEDAVLRLTNNLSQSQNSYGFFFYAGHAVESNGENYLIPVNENIPNENYLRNRAVSVQRILDDMSKAGNKLNIVVLDASRNNPFKEISRGLSTVSESRILNIAANTILVYATSVGENAFDGEGRNGLFTGHLLNHLKNRTLEIYDVFRLTGADVVSASEGVQSPTIVSQFFDTAWLGSSQTD